MNENNLGTTIDNICEDNLNSSIISPAVNGLSDRDAQYLILKTVHIKTKTACLKQLLIRRSLCNISNKSIHMGTFPYCLKHATVKFLYEMDDQTRMRNHRPILYCQQFQRYLTELCTTEYIIIFKFIKRKKDKMVCQYQEMEHTEKN